jgi:hypothetical protein
MKTLKYFLLIGFTAQLLNAQSNITFGGGSSIDVGLGADICAGSITGTLTGDGTQCGSPLLKVLNLTTLIEGFYNGVTMVPDTVTVQFRNTGSPYTLVEQKKIALNSFGAGTGSLTTVLNGASYYLVVKHRNSIETWSKTGKSFTSNLLNYDFTTAATQAYGDNQKLNGTKWCIYGGDVNRDEFIDGSDVSICFNDASIGQSGYVITDLTGDDFVDGTDVTIAFNNSNLGIGSSYPSKKNLPTKKISVTDTQIE